jgi:catechol-2,3-dioxygenase
MIQSDHSSGNLSPQALCHIVLRTTPDHYEHMINFYLNILGGTITHKTHRLCFMTYDHEHHRVAFVVDPTAGMKVPGHPQVGLHHVAFGFARLIDLVVSYEGKKAQGIQPDWCVNHGMSTSMYYRDPDGNELEFQVDNFDTVQEAIDFMSSPAFEQNPVGVDFDPEDLVRRVRSGENDVTIKARPNIGRRDRK